MAASSLYQAIVLDHYRQPRNRGLLGTCAHVADGVNPLCGDSLRIEVALGDDGYIEGLRFGGEACAITTATASMLSEFVPGLSVAEVGAAADRFGSMIAGDDGAAEFGELDAMRELARYPARRKCALLPWVTLRAALAGESSASSENPLA
jgi:nitrogen fixation NifU-like protein